MRECTAEWTAARVREVIVDSMGEQQLSPTASGRALLFLVWCSSRTTQATPLWSAWLAEAVGVLEREVPLLDAPLATCGLRFAGAPRTLPPEALLISGASDAGGSRAALLKWLWMGSIVMGSGRARADGVASSGLYRYSARIVELAAEHAGRTPHTELHYDLLSAACLVVADHVSDAPPQGDSTSERLATQLLCLTDLEFVPALGFGGVRGGYNTQASAAAGAAALVGTRESDEGVALSAVRRPACSWHLGKRASVAAALAALHWAAPRTASASRRRASGSKRRAATVYALDCEPLALGVRVG